MLSARHSSVLTVSLQCFSVTSGWEMLACRHSAFYSQELLRSIALKTTTVKIWIVQDCAAMSAIAELMYSLGLVLIITLNLTRYLCIVTMMMIVTMMIMHVCDTGGQRLGCWACFACWPSCGSPRTRNLFPAGLIWWTTSRTIILFTLAMFVTSTNFWQWIEQAMFNVVVDHGLGGKRR